LDKQLSSNETLPSLAANGTVAEVVTEAVAAAAPASEIAAA